MGDRTGLTRPRILDLFCCEGGAGAGYDRAGFEVVGVDVEWQPRYPFVFSQNDALRVLSDIHFGSASFVAVHASPPCQAHTQAQRLQGNEHPELIGPVRRELRRIGLPYIIENVPGAPLEAPVMLCGTMFGKPYYRHRLFECSFPVTEPLHGQHYLKQVKMGRSAGENEVLQAVGNFAGVDRAREEFEMPWASRDGLRECVPPVFTEFIGTELMAHLETQARRAA